MRQKTNRLIETDIQIDRQTDIQIDRQTDVQRQTYKKFASI